jgi:hypothetical protein
MRRHHPGHTSIAAILIVAPYTFPQLPELLSGRSALLRSHRHSARCRCGPLRIEVEGDSFCVAAVSFLAVLAVIESTHLGDSLDLPRSHPRLTIANHMNRVVEIRSHDS